MFHGTYHTILGRPIYTKFMAVPNYTYLKLKMPGPYGVITIGTSFQRAYECEVECCEHTEQLSPPKSLRPSERRSPRKRPTPSSRLGLSSM